MKPNHKWIIWAFAGAAIFTGTQACENSGGECKTKISQSGGDDSHHNGENCMSCHVSGGKGEGCFIAAGSVYDNSGNSPVNTGTIKLYTGPKGTGTVTATIQVDSKGNFFTSDQINFSGGLYPSYTNSSGTVYMGTVTISGQCGSCHGVSTGKIAAP